MSWKTKRRELREQLRILVLRFFSWTGILSSFYYLCFDPALRREHRAVLRGRLSYHRSLLKIARSSALLRRNVHRLEKGLIMRPRRPVFAEDYILETVKCYARCRAAEGFETGELKWATDVLTEYFAVCGSGPVVDKARALWTRAAAAPDPDATKPSIPYRRADVRLTNIPYEAFHALCVQRRSVRWYKPQAVPVELLRKAIESAAQAPSACNRQPFQFYVAPAPERAAAVGGVPMGTKGFAQGFPCVIVVVGDLAAYPFERDRHVIYIDGALASMQLMLALETLGLSSCPINWPDIEDRERRMAELLELRPEQRPIMLISVGYPDEEGMIPYSHKKSVDDLVRWVQ